MSGDERRAAGRAAPRMAGLSDRGPRRLSGYHRVCTVRAEATFPSRSTHKFQAESALAKRIKKAHTRFEHGST